MKIVLCDIKDEISGFDDLEYVKQKLDYSTLSHDNQQRLLRDFEPISLSWSDRLCLPYISDISKLQEGFERLEPLWRSDCPYKHRCNVFWSPSRSTGNLFPRFIVVGLSPGFDRNYLKTGNWGANIGSGPGPTPVILREALSKLKIISNCWITNAARCAAKSKYPGTMEITNCFNEWLSQEIEILKPEMVIALGQATYAGLTTLVDKSKLRAIRHPAYYARQGKPHDYYQEFKGIA